MREMKSLSILLMLMQCKFNFGIIVNSVAPGIKLRPETGREDHSVYPDYKSILGGKAELPCNVTLSSMDDPITLILWYRGENRTPIYSVDARDNPLSNAKHFPSPDVFTANRATFDLLLRPALLKIDPVKEDDDEEYRCRVDFRWGRTMSTYIRLNVIVPPRKVIIKDERGLPLHDLIGPYDEDSSLRLLCQAEGGKPPPALVWYRENKMIDDSYTNSIDNKTIHNDLLIINLTRSDLLSKYYCHAINPNFTSPIFTSVTLDINLKPLDIYINLVSNSISAGNKAEFICDSSGSRPSAQITWFRDNRPLSHPLSERTIHGNSTTSTLTYIPSADDHRAYLSCRAENLRLANSSIETGLRLNVQYAPQVSLLMGTSTKSSHIKEGDEIFMKCQINANPQTDVIQFMFNGSQIITNSGGITINNSSLVIKSAKKGHKGRYQCITNNTIGIGLSNELLVDIRYTPICKTQKRVFGAALGEKVKIICQVEAEPSDVAFQWTVNNNEQLGSFISFGLNSTLTFIPKTKRDFGVVACRAKNTVGVQKDPCIFSIVAAGLPSPVSGCLVVNQTSSSILIDCISGDDGGLQQNFHLELYDSHSLKLIANMSQSNRAEFTLNNLSSGTQFLAVIYSSNSKGRSATIDLTVPTLSLLNKKFVSEIPQTEDISTLLAIFIGLVLVLIVVIIIVAIICKIRRNRRSNGNDDKDRPLREHRLNANCAIFLSSKDDLNDIQDSSKNPDVIPPIDGYVGFANGDVVMDEDSRYQFQTVNSISSNHVSIQSPRSNIHSLNDFTDKQIGIFPGSDQYSCINITPDVNYINSTQEETKAIQRQRVFPLSTPV